LHHGARGLVLKDEPIAVLIKAIRRVERGELWFERQLLASVIIRRTRSRDHPRQGASSLTEREREVVVLIGEGLRNEQIAARMGVAEKTVRNQLSSIFDKLGVNDRLGLVIYAYRHGLAPLPPA
jgi:DNA-binding NarL/FixJ family response regulator